MGIGDKIIFSKKILSESVNVAAIYSDESINYMCPNEPTANDCVKVRLRIGSNEADDVLFVSEGVEGKMSIEKTQGMFDYYYFNVIPEKNNRKYYFKIVSGEKTLFYCKYGVSENPNEEGSFLINRNYKTPNWAKSAVGYQIFVDRFCNGDKTNDVIDGEYLYLGQQVRSIKDWNKTPEDTDVFNFYGGDIQGVIEKLGYLSELGINMIYFNPLFVSPSNHKYDIQDYGHIDPHLGKIIKDSDINKYAVRTISKENLDASDELFIELVEKAHQYDIRIIIDGVFNHCGSLNKWMDRDNYYEKVSGAKGAFTHTDSLYRGYFKWLENGEYDSWWGHFNHPKLNYENSQELLGYMMNIAQKWLKPPYNADGWRIDVAADLGYSEEFNHKFWKEFRRKVKEASADALIIAEHYGDASKWLNGDEWDTVMNYDAFMEPVSWFFTGMEKHSDSYNEGLFSNGKAFEYAMTNNSIKMGYHAVNISMNELSNHDHSRFLTRTNRRVGRIASVGADAASEGINYGIMREAAIFQFIWTGIPTIYYGDEAGVVGWTDPDDRRTFPWGNENMELINFYKEIIKIRRDNNVLTKGSCRFIYSDNGSVAVARFDDDNCIIAVFNNTNEKRVIKIPVWLTCSNFYGDMKCLISSDINGFNFNFKKYKVINGFVDTEVGAFGAVILKN